MSLAPGTRLGPYEILAPIGAGGMGEVYKARDTRLERAVAIKVLPRHLSANEEVRQRFEREAKTISQLSHPHICALYDVGSHEGTEYLVMELLEGEALSDRLAKGALSLEQTLRYGVEIADALDKAHRQGIVHRDLKPANVMITKSGVKLLDFGLAKMIVPSSPRELTSFPTQANLTQEGTILGTFQYMAPEQLEGGNTDARTDIFAFGAVLYEMATGKKAFTAHSQASLIAAILERDPPPVSTVQPIAPPGLDRVVRRCLAKDPERRWQSARDVALELSEIGSGAAAPVVGAAEPLPRRGAAGWVAAALLLLALLAVLFGPWRRRSPQAASTSVRFTIPPPAGSTLQGMLALAPDGTRLAFVATTADGRDRLLVRPLDSLETRSLEGTDGAEFPFWSPDGRSLAFFADGKLKRIAPDGGGPRTLCDAAAPRGGAWGADGRIVFSANVGGSIDLVPDTGGQPRPLPQLTSVNGEVYRWPSFLPDGRHFLYYVAYGDPKVTGVYVGSVDSSETRRIIPDADAAAVYAASGHLLYRSGDRLMSRPFDVREMRPTGEASPVVEDVWWDGISTLATAFTVSSNGVLAYQTGGLSESQLLLYDRTGKELGPIGAPAAHFEPMFSPDGRSVLVSRGVKQRTWQSETWLADVGRGTMTRLATDPGVNSVTALWSPDGRRVAFAAPPHGDVFVRDIQSSEKPKLLFQLPAFSPLDDWSRDGRYIFYDAIDWKTFHSDVGVRDLELKTSRPLIATSANESTAALSPDGRWIAYLSDESGANEISVQSFPAGSDRQQVSVGGGTQPRWRRDGRELFYVSSDRKVMSVDIHAGERLEAGTPHALFQTRILPPVEARNHYDVTSDGQRFVVNSRRPEDASLPITVVVGSR